MASVEWDMEGELDEDVVGGEVVDPEESLSAQLNGCREESVHGDEYGELEEHGQATA